MLERNEFGHQEGYTSINEAEDHVLHQIMTYQNRCTKCIESFYCNNPKMLSGLAEVANDDLSMIYYFEACVVYLIPMDPVAQKKSKSYSKKRIRFVVDEILFDTKLKKGKVGSGVELCWRNNRYFH